MQSFSLQWKGKGHFLSQKGTERYRQKFLSLIPDWSVLMQMSTPNHHSLIGPQGTVLSVQNKDVLIGWWRCWWEYSCAALIGWGKPLFYWLKYNSKNSFIRAGSDGWNIVQAGSSVQASWSAGPCVKMAAGLCFVCFALFWSWAQLATRSSTRHRHLGCLSLPNPISNDSDWIFMGALFRWPGIWEDGGFIP